MLSPDEEESSFSVNPLPLTSLDNSSKEGNLLLQNDYETSSATYPSVGMHFSSAAKEIWMAVGGGGNARCEVKDSAKTQGKVKITCEGGHSFSSEQGKASMLH